MKQQHTTLGNFSMGTNAQQLQFLLRFVQEPLDVIREGTWLNLSEDLARFLGHDGRQSLSKADCAQLQQETLQMILWHLKEPLDVPGLTFPTLAFGGTALGCEASGALRDVWLLKVYTLLRSREGVHVARCPACRALFYRQPRQDYCSHTCSSRASVQKWRARKRQATA